MADHVDWNLFTLDELRVMATTTFELDVRRDKRKADVVARLEKNDADLVACFDRFVDEHVPPSGPASTRVGKLLRAVASFTDRYFNDGDTLAECIQQSPERYMDAMRDADVWAPYTDIPGKRVDPDGKQQHRDHVRILELIQDTLKRVGDIQNAL